MNQSITTLKSQLPKDIWSEDINIIAPHLKEWREIYNGNTPIMLTPRTTDEVIKCVNACRQNAFKIVPQGGNTGLVGGQIPMGEVLISLTKMNRIREVSKVNSSIIVEAGATLQEVHNAANNINKQFPLFLSSQGSCTIGGNLSTNAGGNHVLKYGTTRDLVFGVEAVLANGDIYNGLTNLRKDNTGYDLSNLFIGAEGTLGIITAASLKLFELPKHTQRALIALQSPKMALELLDHSRCGGRMSMFEVMSHISLNAVTKNFSAIRSPFKKTYPWYVLIDWDSDSKAMGLELAENLLSTAYEKKIIHDAVIAHNETQSKEILSIRENISAGQKFLGGSIKFDITVPIEFIPDFLKKADKLVTKLIPGCRPIAFGHFGDGNIHYNISQPPNVDKEKFLKKWDDASEIVFDIVTELNGSISAEHGIGVMKKRELAKRSDPVKYNMLKLIKNALDPDNTMNPRVLLHRS
jgi:FAD/FMN-containing dehydrogenase